MLLPTGTYLVQQQFLRFRVVLALFIKCSNSKISTTPMPNKFLTDTLCSVIKTLPEDYISNIIGKRASYKLICKLELIYTADNMQYGVT